MSIQDFRRDWRTYAHAICDRFPDVPESRVADADGDPDAMARIVAAHSDLTPNEASAAVTEVLTGPMPADGFAHPSHDNAAVTQSDAYVPEGEDVLADDARFGDGTAPEPPIGRTTK